jgi:hypothetical protein
MREGMMISKVGEPWPQDHYVQGIVNIPAIRPDDAAGVHAEMLDVTSVADGPFRRYMSGPVRVTGKHGETLMSGGADEVQAALEGGGDYYRLMPYGEHGPITREEHEREEELAAYYDALDWE